MGIVEKFANEAGAFRGFFGGWWGRWWAGMSGGVRDFCVVGASEAVRGREKTSFVLVETPEELLPHLLPPLDAFNIGDSRSDVYNRRDDTANPILLADLL